MSQHLPTRNFRWLNEEEIKDLKENVKNVPDENDQGYILEVDLGKNII